MSIIESIKSHHFVRQGHDFTAGDRMKRFLIIFALLLATTTAFAQIPQTMSYQGVLHDNGGAPYQGAHTLVFSLFDAQTGGNLVWSETHSNEPIVDGVFSVILGAPKKGVAVPLGVTFDKAHWLEISINGSVLPTRVALTAVPYALNASHVSADAAVTKLNNVTGDVTVTGGDNVTVTTDETGKTVTISAVGSESAWTDNDGKLTYEGGHVGIGKNDPQSNLDVAGSMRASKDGDNASWIEMAHGQDNPFFKWDGTGNLGFRHNSQFNQNLMLLDQDGNLSVTGSVSADGDLSVTGDVSATGNLFVAGDVSADGTVTATGLKLSTNATAGYVLTSDAEGIASWQQAVVPSEIWSQNGNAVFYDSGLVGIGKSNPQRKLDVASIVRASKDDENLSWVEMGHGQDHPFLRWNGTGDLGFRHNDNPISNLMKLDQGGNLLVKGDVSSNGHVSAKGDVFAEGNVSATGNLSAEGNVSTTGGMSAEGNVSVAGSVLIGGANAQTPFALRAATGTSDVGITQGLVGSGATMEFTTDDGNGQQATRLLLRGAGGGADIEFYRGTRGSEKKSMHIEGDNGRVGIGEDLPDSPLHVKANQENHVLKIENTQTSDSSDGLMIYIHGNGDKPDPSNDYITFWHGDRDPVGVIEGNGNNGIRLQSNSSDFAEYLPRLNAHEKILPGDLVGVYGGKITRTTKGAERVMVVSDQAIVAGNAPPEGEEGLYETVGFIGQVKTHVRGVVHKGDYIVASGEEDGTGVAVRPEDLNAEHLPMILGRAWEAKDTENVARVNVSIGLGLGEAQASLFAQMRSEMAELRQSNRQLQRAVSEMAKVKAQMAVMQAMMEKMIKKQSSELRTQTVGTTARISDSE